MEAKRCELCSNEICQNQPGAGQNPVDEKYTEFLNNLKEVSQNMSMLLSPLINVGTFTPGERLTSTEYQVRHY